MAKTKIESFGICGIVILLIYKQSGFSYKKSALFVLKCAVSGIRSIAMYFVI